MTTPLVSLDDADLLAWSWSLAGGSRADRRYPARNVGGRTLYLHRVIAHRMGLLDAPIGGEHGQWAESIDHINGNKLDNRRENLRRISRSAQMLNPNDALRSTNTTGVRGVSYYPNRKRNPWMAHATKDRKSMNLGWFPTIEAARERRQAWEREVAS